MRVLGVSKGTNNVTVSSSAWSKAAMKVLVNLQGMLVIKVTIWSSKLLVRENLNFMTAYQTKVSWCTRHGVIVIDNSKN